MCDYTASFLDLAHRTVDNISGHFLRECDDDGLQLVNGNSTLRDSKSCNDRSEEAHIVVVRVV